MQENSPHAGFTLLELMVIIAIIGIVTSIAVGGLRSMVPRMRLNAAVRDLRGDMQRCKMAAIRNNTECLMVFEEGTQSGDSGNYTACFDTNDNNDCDVGEEKVLSKNLNDNDFVGVWLDDAGFCFGYPDVNFNSRGLPNCNGGVDLKNLKGDKRVLNVSKTGRIQIEE